VTFRITQAPEDPQASSIHRYILSEFDLEGKNLSITRNAADLGPLATVLYDLAQGKALVAVNRLDPIPTFTPLLAPRTEAFWTAKLNELYPGWKSDGNSWLISALIRSNGICPLLPKKISAPANSPPTAKATVKTTMANIYAAPGISAGNPPVSQKAVGSDLTIYEQKDV
jgi:hypothetical protein